MKIVEYRQKTETFGELGVGEVFTSDCKVFMKIMKEQKTPAGLDLKSGYVYTFGNTETVIPLPNAELYLNK